ncbi:Integrase family protein [Gammaproteobacteria bacterium]
MDNRFSFTKTAIESLPVPPSGERAIYHDTHKNAVGLQLRVTATAKTFFMQKRVNGTPERVTLGRFPDMTIEQARKKAAEVNATIAKGESPIAAKRRTIMESKTLSEAFSDYLNRRILKPQTVFDINRCMKEIFPDWLDKPLVKITGDMAVSRHREYGERSQARANLAMRYLRAVFNFAMAEYQSDDGEPIIKTNPVKKLSATKAWFRVDRRQNIIKQHELSAWVTAIMELPNEVHRDYLLIVLLTGLRRSEALALTWDNIDLNGKTLTVIDPKNHHDHTLPLSDYLTDLFIHRKAVTASNFVFADGQGHRISNFRHTQATITTKTGVSFTIHDLRRTFATIAESLDIPSYALKRLLNHATGADVTAGYIVASVERLRAPMQKITDYVLKMAGVKPTAEVIPLHRVA